MDMQVLAISENSPDKLYNQCLYYLMNNLNCISKVNVNSAFIPCQLRNDIVLPAEICEDFLQVYQRDACVHDGIASLFNDINQTRLNTVKLRNSEISIEGFRSLMQHKPREVDLVQCEHLNQDAVEVINEYSANLIYLRLGLHTNILCYNDDKFNDRGYIIYAPNLRKLVINRCLLTMSPLSLLKPLSNLVCLDLSESSILILSLNWSELVNLKSLILYNVPLTRSNFEAIITLKSLKHLDISQAVEKHGKYSSPDDTLRELITNLPHLESLDISGTNLAGTGTAVVANVLTVSGNEELRCDIPGLVSRVKNPLKFLGLYGTQHGACSRHDIPAKIISGEANETQILMAALSFIDRPAMLNRILNDLYYLFRYENNVNISHSLYIILMAMERHLSEKHIQISGSATLFYIVKSNKVKDNIGIMLKRRIIKALLAGMEAHSEDDTMLRNGCLTLCQFKIPAEVLFQYERIVLLLLNGVSDVIQESFVQRIAIYLLNSLACQVNGNQKLFLGNNGAVRIMLNLIKDRLDRNVCDDVLEVAWSTMWNVTDETPENCQHFLNCSGMEYFLACLKSFPDKDDLLRNMMGLLGNVAEVAYLRPRLMNQLFLDVFHELLDSSSDGIEVSYNAAGVIAYIASDGEKAWTVEEPSRKAVLDRVTRAIDRWDIRSERNINYRSFEPIISLLESSHTPQCQHWATWALANLTTVYPSKYCHLVVMEGGLEMLNDILDQDTPYKRVKELAELVIANCARQTLNDDDDNSLALSFQGN